MIKKSKKKITGNQQLTTLEKILTSTCKADMISYLDTHPEDFDESIKLAISNKQPYSWRGAWLLWSCMEENDQRVQEYVNSIVNTLTTKKEDHQRELIKILLQMELKEEHEGILFDVCVTVWQKLDNKPSIRFTAFKMLVKIAKGHPDLINEIAFLTQNEYLNSFSHTAQKSINKILKDLNENENRP